MFQQIILMGNLGSDVESRTTQGGKKVANFRLAVNKQWTDGSGEKREKTTWFRVSAWDKQAELASLYLTRGRQVMVIGEVEEASAYTNKAGESAANIEVTAQSIKFLGGSGNGTDGSASNGRMTATALNEADIPF